MCGHAVGHAGARSRGDRQPAQGDLHVRRRPERDDPTRLPWCSSTCSTTRASGSGATTISRRSRRRPGSRGRRSSTRARSSCRTTPTSARRTSASGSTRRRPASGCRSAPPRFRAASTKSRSSSSCPSPRTSSSSIRKAGTRRKCRRRTRRTSGSGPRRRRRSRSATRRRTRRFYLEFDARTDQFSAAPAGHGQVGRSGHRDVRRRLEGSEARLLPVAAAQLGTADMSELTLDVDQTFVPGGGDMRELGIRVFHAFIEPK